ncbi:hypothetical protein [Chryseobacterium polytrichastri]|uniref:BclA C-terminal domain-containing protein n=1 Tax=Chryseobacterium polytrichastri TaxID=1302687 RepID=A0A1M6XLR5_9FLAO|nr:hypothetical protein [Chryseobacterium polytrichastri]SHL06914.1 hypothetical protein SAMN05444267_101152 [Chryseobacterium polytrichastri]
MRNLVLSIGFFSALTLNAQVGINTITPKASLDINKSVNTTSAEGFLTVRITGTDLAAKDNLYGADQNSTVVYATSAPGTPTTKTSNITSPGFYYYKNSISKWVGLTMPKFFYMPSILFDTTTLGAGTKDLYQLYLTQFSTPAVSSTGSAGKIPVLERGDLEYYVTYLDSTVFTGVTINASGVMNYTVSSNATEASFMNIVFVVK